MNIRTTLFSIILIFNSLSALSTDIKSDVITRPANDYQKEGSKTTAIGASVAASATIGHISLEKILGPIVRSSVNDAKELPGLKIDNYFRDRKDVNIGKLKGYLILQETLEETQKRSQQIRKDGLLGLGKSSADLNEFEKSLFQKALNKSDSITAIAGKAKEIDFTFLKKYHPKAYQEATQAVTYAINAVEYGIKDNMLPQQEKLKRLLAEFNDEAKKVDTRKTIIIENAEKDKVWFQYSKRFFGALALLGYIKVADAMTSEEGYEDFYLLDVYQDLKNCDKYDPNNPDSTLIGEAICNKAATTARGQYKDIDEEEIEIRPYNYATSKQ